MTTLISLVVGLIGAPIAFVVQYFLGTGDEWINWVITYIPTWGIVIILIFGVLIGFGMIPAILQLSNKLAIWHGRMIQKALTRQILFSFLFFEQADLERYNIKMLKEKKCKKASK